jgi:hypothetical protein
MDATIAQPNRLAARRKERGGGRCDQSRPSRIGRTIGTCPAAGPVVDLNRRWLIVDAFFKLVAAGPLFFVSAWLLMIFAGIVGAEVGIHPFGYITAMVVTIALWLTLAPAIGAVGRAKGKSKT